MRIFIGRKVMSSIVVLLTIRLFVYQRKLKVNLLSQLEKRDLANLKHCEAIVLPDTVRYIGKGAFTIDNKLKYVHFW